MPSRAATVATLVLPTERTRIEAAGHGCFTAMHGETIEDAARAARDGAVDALFVSVHRCSEAELPRVARFVNEFPHVPAVALISRAEGATPDRVLRLGASGVRAVVDVSLPAGWRRLRELVREPTSPVVASFMAELDADLADAPADCRLFFELVVRRATEHVTIGELCGALRIVPSSLMARFFRAGLPSPRTYLVHARLLHAAWLFRSEGLSIHDVAARLDYSSSQSLGRHLKTLLGMTAGEYRRRYPFALALARYRERLVTPYRDRLLAFHPFGTMPGDHGPTEA
jgi:AraC-like DNA-binding protein